MTDNMPYPEKPVQAKRPHLLKVGRIASGLLVLLFAIGVLIISINAKESAELQNTQANIIAAQQEEIDRLEYRTTVLGIQTHELMRQLKEHEQLQPYRSLALREAPQDLICPAYNSPQAKQAVNPGAGSRVNVPKTHMGNMLVMGASNTVVISPAGRIEGDLILCGASNVLVLDGKMDSALEGRVLMQGASVKVMLTDESPDPEWSNFFGHRVEVWRCTLVHDPRYQPCTF